MVIAGAVIGGVSGRFKGLFACDIIDLPFCDEVTSPACGVATGLNGRTEFLILEGIQICEAS